MDQSIAPVSPIDVHELVIQVPAATHQQPAQIRYSHAQHSSPDRSRSVSPIQTFREDFLGDEAGTGSSRSPPRRFPTRSTSLGSRAHKIHRPVTPRIETRLDSVVSSPEMAAHERDATVRSPESESRGLSPQKSEISGVASPVSGRSQSPTLVRTMSGRSAARSPVSAEEIIPMQSMFPQYNPHVPLASQQYVPARDVATPAHLPMEKISRVPYSPPATTQSPPGPMFVTPQSELNRLWEFSNGQPVTPGGGPSSFSLQLHRPSRTASSSKSSKERPQITFGSGPKRAFYSLRQSDLEPEVVSDEAGNSHQLQAHELMVLRHHPNRPDVLPLAHMDISPPPPPSLSTTHSIPVASSSGFPIDVEANATSTNHLPHHITTIEPALASLAALRAAADSPIAISLAQADPNANSSEARNLAETAMAQAMERESAELLWRRTSPSSGVYELLHPALGVLKISVEGNISGKLDVEPSGKSVKSLAKIALLRPGPPLRDVKLEDQPAQLPEPESDELVCLDFSSGLLDVNAGGLAALGNPYICDVAVAAVFAVAVAESRRDKDPGLAFDAPPTPKIERTATPKQSKRKQQQTSDGWEERELPRSARILTGVLKFVFKSILWTAGLGLRLLFRILRGMGRCLLPK